MERRLAFPVILQHLKLSKWPFCCCKFCSLCNSSISKLGNCKKCKCRKISWSNVESRRYETDISTICDRSAVVSLNKENAENLCQSLDIKKTKLNQPLSDSQNIKNFDIKHGITNQSHQIASPTTSKTLSTSSKDKNDFKNLFLIHLKRHSIIKKHEQKNGRFMNILFKKLYMSLKEKQLIPNYHQVEENEKDFVTKLKNKSLGPLEMTVLDGKKRKRNSKSGCTIDSELAVSVESEEGESQDASSSSVEDVFGRLMFNKYHHPSADEAKRLLAIFPQPKNLVSDVFKPMIEADAGCVMSVTVTSHLGHRYWKARLAFSWLKKVTSAAINPNKDLAIQGAYLYMCQRLQDLGLIYQNSDGNWVPMSCDIVATMLETLSKYGESSMGSSKGRGFKIILEQARVKDINSSDKGDNAQNNYEAERWYGTSCADSLKEIKRIKHYQEGVKDVNGKGLSPENLGNNIYSPLLLDKIITYDNVRPASDISCIDMEVTDRDNGIFSYHVGQINKPNWICTVHIGWPFPFSVQAQGQSLPAAQVMGFLAVVNKLKMLKLLTCCNSSISWVNVESLMVIYTRQHWNKSINQICDKATVEKFGADAEVFCDASTIGFGAFLLLKETRKVRWISESWEEHKENNFHCLMSNNKQKFYSTSGELFAIVTAIFTWKQKLRNRRVLCFSDNMIIMGFINLLMLKPFKGNTSIDSLDYLFHVLHATCLQYNITLQATWHDRGKNRLADLLSRNDITAFQAAAPSAASRKTKAKKIIIKDN